MRARRLDRHARRIRRAQRAQQRRRAATDARRRLVHQLEPLLHELYDVHGHQRLNLRKTRLEELVLGQLGHVAEHVADQLVHAVDEHLVVLQVQLHAKLVDDLGRQSRTKVQKQVMVELQVLLGRADSDSYVQKKAIQHFESKHNQQPDYLLFEVEVRAEFDHAGCRLESLDGILFVVHVHLWSNSNTFEFYLCLARVFW